MDTLLGTTAYQSTTLEKLNAFKHVDIVMATC